VQRTCLDGFAGEFFTLYLLDHAQGLGLGRRMMATMAASLLDRGMRDALVWVLDGNPSCWFYERLGGTRLAFHRGHLSGIPVGEVAYGWRDLTSLAGLSADLT
jgi:L-amino acid N-acyltransferase YncA